MSESVMIAELAGQLHTLEAEGKETWTTCGDALDPRDIPQYRAPGGAAWNPEKHANPCPECFPRLNGALPKPVVEVTARALRCQPCQRSFGTEHGLKVHRARAHKLSGPAKQPTKIPATQSKYDGVAAAKLKRDANEPPISLSCQEDDCGYTAETRAQLGGHKSGHARRKKTHVVPTTPEDSSQSDDGNDDPHGSAPETSSHDESDDSGGRGPIEPGYREEGQGKSSFAFTMAQFMEKVRQLDSRDVFFEFTGAQKPDSDITALLEALEEEYGEEVYGFARGFLRARGVRL